MSNTKVLALSGSEESIRHLIFTVREKRVMVDKDLAALYQVTTSAMNQAVRRNIYRFPADFMFQLSKPEMRELITNCDRFKPLKHAPQPSYVFTENGVAMLSSVLSSNYAIRVNIQIMRAFTHIREYLSKHRDLEKWLDDHERKCDAQHRAVFQAMRQLLKTPVKKSNPIGFHVKYA